MIFVYPAIVSNNVDKKIAPAVCKILEQFYLSHIAEAFQNGDLRVKSEFDEQKKVYGPLKLENKKVFGKVFLSEAQKPGVSSFPEVDDLNNEVNAFIKKINKDGISASGLKDKDDVHVRRDTYSEYLSDIIHFIARAVQAEDHIKSIPNYDAHDPKTKQALMDLKNITSKLNDQKSNIESILKILDSKERSFPKDDKKLEYEKGKETAAQYETHGSYKVEMMKGVSLKPTLMNLSIKIHYVDGPHEAYGGVTPSGSMQEIAIGCKILPMMLQSFASIEEAILTDYFATSHQIAWRAFYRNFLRNSIRWVEGKIKWLTGKSVNLLKNADPATAEILLAPQGSINASSFRNKSGAPGFYNYSSAIVVFNKDDIIKEEGANFFLDKHQLSKMFKVGWNSFCILDPLREEAMFITALDGGYLHIIPYAYIFNALGMDQIYTNMNDLQRRSPVFRQKSGSFSSLVSRLKRESALFSAVNNFISERRHGENK